MLAFGVNVNDNFFEVLDTYTQRLPMHRNQSRTSTAPVRGADHLRAIFLSYYHVIQWLVAHMKAVA